jgi:maltodextrin utilization protein YvdJ
MGIWSAVGYVVGVAILTAIIFIPIAVVAVLLDNYEISKIITPALNVLFIAIYSLLAGYLFCKEYKKDDDKSATKDQGESQE